MPEHITIRPDGSWEFHGDESRTKARQQSNIRLFNKVTGEFEYQAVDRVYCMNCGTFSGYAGSASTWIKFVCDDCYYGKGIRPENFVPMLPTEEVAWLNSR